MKMKKLLLYSILALMGTIFFVSFIECKKISHPSDMIDFNFDNMELTNIISMLAEKEEKNILFPQIAPIQQKINIHLPYKISIEQAWEFISTFLNLAGYTMIPHNGVIQIIKNDANSNRETLPIYVGFNPEDFPHTETKIRAILYLTNLKVPEKYDDKPTATEPINMILTDVLSANKSVMYDTKSNAIIASDSANKLATAFNIILLLDRSGDPNVLEVVQLYNVDASVIADILKTQILALTGDQKGALKADVKSETGLYFGSGTVHLAADTRLNAIMLTGSGPTIERIKDLIAELDQPADSGRSILHVYELQYLEADIFAPALDKLLKAGAESGQATKDLQGGSRRMFEGVVVTAENKIKETIRKYEESTEAGKAGSLKSEELQRGGNRLIITAREQDWFRIRDLIQSLDVPQNIIIIEVLVVDVSINETKILGAQLRNLSPANATQAPIFANGVTEQSAFLNAPVLNTTVNAGTITTVPEPAKLASDLLSLVFPGSSSTISTNAFSIAQSLSATNPGSLILSINDPNGSGIWGVLQILDSFSDVKILSHPFLVAKNNKEAEAIISTIKRDQGQAYAGQAAVVVQKVEDIDARLRVGVTPRASSIDRINIQVAVDVQDFTTAAATEYTRNTRTVNTNANISSGQVLALGGLGVLSETESVSKIPILADIPIIGPLFQTSTRNTTISNLLILIAPTVIQPKIRGGLEIYTRDKVSTGFEVFETRSVIGNPRDPVTRWFFKSKLEDAQETANVYLSQANGDFVREFERGRNKKRDNTRPNRTRRRIRNRQSKTQQNPIDQEKTYKTESRFGL